MKVYNRKLSAAEVTTNFTAAFAPGQGITDGLVYELRIDEGQGSLLRERALEQHSTLSYGSWAYIPNPRLSQLGSSALTQTVFCQGGYRFGFNGQERDDEVSGAGNSLTAMYWQYDARLGRRWNVDPKPNASISMYATFANNPIMLADPNGDTTKFRTHEEFRDVLSASISSGAFAQKINELRKSQNTYTYNNTSNTQGVVGSIEQTGENTYQINYTTNSVGQENELGQSPFHSLFEETYHAEDFEKGNPTVCINPESNLLQTTDPQNFEAQAWKWTADNAPYAKNSFTFYNRGPRGQVTNNPFFNTTLTTNAPLIMQMKAADIEQIKVMLFQGYTIPYTNPEGNTRNMDYKGPYQ